MAQYPGAMQLRFLQTVAEVATEKNSTLVMPIPVELLSVLGRPSILGGGPDDGRPAMPPPPPPRPASGPDDGRSSGEENGRPG
jgi:hypothetical protein